MDQEDLVDPELLVDLTDPVGLRVRELPADLEHLVGLRVRVFQEFHVFLMVLEGLTVPEHPEAPEDQEFPVFLLVQEVLEDPEPLEGLMDLDLPVDREVRKELPGNLKSDS